MKIRENDQNRRKRSKYEKMIKREEYHQIFLKNEKKTTNKQKIFFEKNHIKTLKTLKKPMKHQILKMHFIVCSSKIQKKFRSVSVINPHMDYMDSYINVVIFVVIKSQRVYLSVNQMLTLSLIWGCSFAKFHLKLIYIAHYEVVNETIPLFCFGLFFIFSHGTLSIFLMIYQNICTLQQSCLFPSSKAVLALFYI